MLRMFLLMQHLCNMKHIILGLDPGFAITGYGVLILEKGVITPVTYGCIRTKAGVDFPKRLLQIHKDLKTIIERYNPTMISIEELFFYNNAKTAIHVSHARGVLMLTAMQYNIALYEYTPLQIKQAVTGYGKANKKQMQQMIQMLLKLDHIPKPDDAADALGIALCAAYSKKLNDLA